MQKATPAGAAAEVDAGQRRVVGVVDGDVVVALVGEDPQLRRQVGLEVVVAVEVVGGEVEEDRALGREVAGVLELEAGGLADHGRVRLDLADQLRERRADVAGDRDRLTGAAVDVAEQLDRGRLAVGPGHRDEAVGQRPPGQLQLPDDVDPPLQRGRDHRRLPGNARALDDGPRPLEQCKSIRIQERLRRRPPKAFPPLSGLPESTPRTALPAPRQQPRGRLARAGQADDQERARRAAAGGVSWAAAHSSEDAFAPRRPRTCRATVSARSTAGTA